MTDRYDVVIIGSGAGGGTMARALADTSARILVLERGDRVPQEPDNWDPNAVWKQLRYRTSEQWLDERGHPFVPYTHYNVGGNTKFWGSVLYRLRREDFQAVAHVDGVSPAWPIDYETLAPYYDLAERMYHVHGEQGADPTDPPRGPFPCEPIAHQPRMASIVASLRHQGLHPSPLPLGLLRPLESGGCILCDTCNSFPCRIQAKSDAEVCGIVPALEHPNVELWTNAYARRLVANRAATRVEAVEIDRAGRTLTVGASVFVVSCGAVNSPALLLRSRGGAHPNGLANSSGLVGRRYMAHLATMVSGISPWQRNETVFQKTVAINDFYLSRGRGSYPLGQIQSQGRIHPVMLPSGAPPRLRRNARRVPLSVYERCWTSRSIDWLAMSEDLPSDDNRVTVEAGGQIRLQYRPNNLTAHRQLVRRTKRILRKAGLWFPVAVSLGASNTTHQCGTLCFGTDARTSVLDPWCRAHDVDNLFVVDASFFPSSAAVNPGLTIVAQALRVAEHIKRTDLKTAVAPTPSSAVDRLGPVPGDERPRTND